MATARSLRVLLLGVVAACGARSQLESPGPSSDAASPRDAADFTDAAPAPSASADAQPPPTCTGGVVVDSATNPWFLALDATDLYFIDKGSPSVATDSSIGRCAKATGCAGASAETIVSGLDSPVGFAIDDTSLYWTELSSGAAFSCDKHSCHPLRLFTDSNDEPITVLADGALLNLLSYHAVETCPTSGCAAPQKLTDLTYGALVLAADASWIYYTEASPQGAPRGSVFACAKPATRRAASFLVKTAVDASSWAAGCGHVRAEGSRRAQRDVDRGERGAEGPLRPHRGGVRGVDRDMRQLRRACRAREGSRQ